ncbi:hypothetical protein FTX61_18025 [Nitriliruptoraceae bacterium ZYF776]|nr:hypothetical protein [Profundirhabdus halotolerans]
MTAATSSPARSTSSGGSEPPSRTSRGELRAVPTRPAPAAPRARRRAARRRRLRVLGALRAADQRDHLAGLRGGRGVADRAGPPCAGGPALAGEGRGGRCGRDRRRLGRLPRCRRPDEPRPARRFDVRAAGLDAGGRDGARPTVGPRRGATPTTGRAGGDRGGVGRLPPRPHGGPHLRSDVEVAVARRVARRRRGRDGGVGRCHRRPAAPARGDRAVTAWLLALTGPAVAVVAIVGGLDLVRRRDLGWRGKLVWALAVLVAPPFAGLLYVLTRPATADRSLLGAPVGGDPRDPAAGSARARLLRQLGRLAARGLFRSVEVVRPASVRTDGPQLWVASHFGAFSDPIVLLHALERPPRFLAADALFRLPVLGWLLRLAGAIPVRRSQDGGGGANEAAFASAWAALRRGDPVAIFPEGIATDEAAIAPLRTGAARIALGAAAADLQLVPVGIHYEDKAGLRRRVFVDIGAPLHLDDWLAATGGDPAERSTVRALTDELETRLRRVAPEFADRDEQHALLAAAGVALALPGRPAPTYGARADLADELGRRSAAERGELVAAVAAYRAGLEAAGVEDAAVAGAPRASLRRVLAQAVVGASLLPAAVLGAVLHAPLVGLAWASGLLRLRPATAATVRPLVAVAAAAVTWSVAAWAAAAADLVDGVTAALAAGFVLVPLWGLAALVVGERLALVVRAVLRHVRRPGRPRDLTDVLADDRRRIVELVAAAPPSPAPDAAP